MTLQQCLVSGLCLITINLTAQENAAPSIHLVSYFPSSDAILKMNKIKIVQSAYAEYFEVNSFTNGYSGLQQTPSTAFGTPNILIFSLWDVNTASEIYSHVDYFNPLTDTGRFGGEGNGYRTIYPYNWTLNTWYNLVVRSWKSKDSLRIAMFINDLSSGSWLHSATLSIPDPGPYLSSYNDAFMENWTGTNPAWDGSFIRAAYFKDAWNINLSGEWEKNTSAFFSANNSPADVTRNGIYHNSFNAYFDNTEDAYYLQHGGSTTPSAAFSGGRTLTLPAQANQGDAPLLTIGSLTGVTANNAAGETTVTWTIDQLKSPQLSAKVEILNSLNSVLATFEDTLPQRRTVSLNTTLPDGTYTARVTIRDIFNQLSNSVTAAFVVTGPLPLNLLSFKGESNWNSVVLTWQTDNEVNTAHFEPQRSADGINFMAIGIVPARGSAGSINAYSYTDHVNATGRIFYRLKMTDIDGKSSYSEVIRLKLTNEKGYIVFPNPTNGVFQIEGKEVKDVTIYNEIGVKVLCQILNNYNTTFNLSNFPKGFYMISLQEHDGKLYNIKLLLK